MANPPSPSHGYGRFWSLATGYERPKPRVTVGFYGDDVTGSVDVMLQFARRGMRGRLFVGMPEGGALAAAAGDEDVVGIAGIARSLATDELADEVVPALRALAALAPAIVQYKACSTADSSPSIGSLGRVLELARPLFGDRAVPMLFAQPDFGRFTAFGTHFAAEGGTVHRLDRQPTMSTHPSTPMHEADLVRHFSQQTDLPLGSLTLRDYTSATAVAAALDAPQPAALVLDALDEEHLALIGSALLRAAAERPPLFAIGSGGLSTAVALASGKEAVTLAPAQRSAKPVLVVSGSRSPQTRRQVEEAASRGWLVQPLPGPDTAATGIVSALASGRNVALTSDDAAFAGDAETVLAAIAEAAASVVLAATEAHAVSRVIVCGGDTSGRVVRLLDVRSLSITANPEGNVVILRAEAEGSADGLELVLKGGQVGADDLFVRLAPAGSRSA